MADWATISALATAGGTLVLAIATYGSVRSANKAARTAERALLAGLRPLLISSRLQDPVQKVSWSDEHWSKVEGGRASVDVVDDVIYLVLSLRNAGAGIAVLHGWYPLERWASGDPPAPADEFRRLTRDIYIPPGEIGFWQGAVREADDAVRAWLPAAVAARQAFTVDILYGDQEGGQRVVSRFGVLPDSSEGWLCTAGRHWNVDRADPR